MTSNNLQRGFTLIELLVVIAIIGMLASVVLSNLQETRALANDARRLADMRQIRIAMESFYSKNGRYPDFSHDSVSSSGEYIGVGDDIDTALRPYLDPTPKDPKHDGVLYFYSYDAYHEIGMVNCPGAAPGTPWGPVFGFNKAEGSGNFQKQTICGTDMNLDDADYNQAFVKTILP